MSHIVPCQEYKVSQGSPIALSRESFTVRAIQNQIGNMYFLPISRQQDLHWKFSILAKTWEEETTYLSSIQDICMHPAYQKIIGMGDEAVPLILRELQKEKNHWFWALEAITGEDPVQTQNRGIIDKMAEDWILWGKRNRKF